MVSHRVRVLYRRQLRSVFPKLLCATLACAPATTQDDPDEAKPIKLQPDALDLGTLRVGTRVEANLIVFWNDGSSPGEQATVEVPEFVRLVRHDTAPRERVGPRTRVWISVDTAKSRTIEGSIEVRRRGRRVAVPLDAVVLDRSPLSPRVLVAETPFDGFSTADGTLFDTWRRIVAIGKLEVSYISPGPKGTAVLSAEQLQRVDVVLLGETGLIRLTDTDLGLLHGFVCGGGRVVVAANHFFRGTVTKANEVLAPFGLEMDDVEPRGSGTLEMTHEEIVQHGLTTKVATITAKRPSPTRITDSQRARALIRIPHEGDLAFTAIATTETGGEIVTLGVSLWWNWVRDHADNARLMRNLLTRARGDGRRHGPADDR